MKFRQIALTGTFAIMVAAAPAIAQTSGAPGSLPSPAGPNVPSPGTGPNVGPAMPGDTRPTTPGMPSAPTPRIPGISPSASPPTTSPTTAPASRNDCVGGGWTKFPTQGFANEGDCMTWLNTQGK